MPLLTATTTSTIALTPTQTIITNVPDAVIICCALAWHGNALSGQDCPRQHLDRIIATACASHTHHQLLNWRSHTTPSTWDLRWRWAHRLTRKRYPHSLGIRTLPADHTELPAAPRLTRAPRATR